MIPVLIGFALTQLRRLSAFYDFTVIESPAGLQVRRGLFERNSQTITLSRVQGVVVSEPLLWRGFGWAKLDVAVAGYSQRSDGEGRPSASTVMPVAPRPVVLALARSCSRTPGAPTRTPCTLIPPPPRARWVAPVRRRFMSAGRGEHLVVSREGIINRRTHVVPHARVQSLRLHQGPWQRRLGLADLHVDSPPGPVSVRARHRVVGGGTRAARRGERRGPGRPQGRRPCQLTGLADRADDPPEVAEPALLRELGALRRLGEGVAGRPPGRGLASSGDGRSPETPSSRSTSRCRRTTPPTRSATASTATWRGHVARPVRHHVHLAAVAVATAATRTAAGCRPTWP